MHSPDKITFRVELQVPCENNMNINVVMAAMTVRASYRGQGWVIPSTLVSVTVN